MCIKRLTILIFFLAAIYLGGCVPHEEWAPMSIKNDTNQALTFYIAVSDGDITDQTTRDSIGVVQPANEIRPYVMDGFSKYLVEARDSKNQIVYSRVFMREELKRMKWRIVISTVDLKGV